MKIIRIVGSAHVELSEDDLITLINALNEMCNGIEVFEFQTRLGRSVTEVREMLNEFDDLLKETRKWQFLHRDDEG